MQRSSQRRPPGRSPAEAQSLSALLEAQRKVIETADLAIRLDKLEAELAVRPQAR